MKEGKNFGDRLLSLSWYLQDPPKEEPIVQAPEQPAETKNTQEDEESSSQEAVPENFSEPIQNNRTPSPVQDSAFTQEEVNFRDFYIFLSA